MLLMLIHALGIPNCVVEIKLLCCWVFVILVKMTNWVGL